MAKPKHGTSIQLKSHFFVTLNALNHFNEHSVLTNTHPLFTSHKIENCWQTLVQHYTEPHRYYHTLKHIQAMLEYLAKYQHVLEYPTAVALAIYYHDIIYDPRRSDNEQKSAEVFISELATHLPSQMTDRVVQLILLTEKHQIKDNEGDEVDKNNRGNKEAKIFLDMDLSILGQPSEVYEKYVLSIRQEYQHVSDKNYREGRRAILSNFLQRPRLYFSDEFYQLFEKQARCNLQTEINHWLLFS